MKISWRITWFVIPFSFCIGAWWGLKNLEEQRQLKSLVLGEVHILSLKGFIPPFVLKEFSEQERIQVQLTEVGDERALLEKMRQGRIHYDLIQVPSYMATRMIREQGLQANDYRQLQSVEKLSADFLGLKADPQNNYLIPLGWGVNGWAVKSTEKEKSFRLSQLFNDSTWKSQVLLLPSPLEVFSFFTKKHAVAPNWIRAEKKEQLWTAGESFVKDLNYSNLRKASDKRFVQMNQAQFAYQKRSRSSYQFKIPLEGANFWVQSIALGKNAKNFDESMSFVDFLLTDSISSRMTEANFWSTTLKSLEDADLLPEIKASYIRKLPLNRLHFLTENLALHPLWVELLKKYSADKIAAVDEKENNP